MHHFSASLQILSSNVDLLSLEIGCRCLQVPLPRLGSERKGRCLPQRLDLCFGSLAPRYWSQDWQTVRHFTNLRDYVTLTLLNPISIPAADISIFALLKLILSAKVLAIVDILGIIVL